MILSYFLVLCSIYVYILGKLDIKEKSKYHKKFLKRDERTSEK